MSRVGIPVRAFVQDRPDTPVPVRAFVASREIVSAALIHGDVGLQGLLHLNVAGHISHFNYAKIKAYVTPFNRRGVASALVHAFIEGPKSATARVKYSLGTRYDTWTISRLRGHLSKPVVAARVSAHIVPNVWVTDTPRVQDNVILAWATFGARVAAAIYATHHRTIASVHGALEIPGRISARVSASVGWRKSISASVSAFIGSQNQPTPIHGYVALLGEKSITRVSATIRAYTPVARIRGHVIIPPSLIEIKRNTRIRSYLIVPMVSKTAVSGTVYCQGAFRALVSADVHPRFAATTRAVVSAHIHDRLARFGGVMPARESTTRVTGYLGRRRARHAYVSAAIQHEVEAPLRTRVSAYIHGCVQFATATVRVEIIERVPARVFAHVTLQPIPSGQCQCVFAACVKARIVCQEVLVGVLPDDCYELRGCLPQGPNVLERKMYADSNKVYPRWQPQVRCFNRPLEEVHALLARHFDPGRQTTPLPRHVDDARTLLQKGREAGNILSPGEILHAIESSQQEPPE
jgi:hypothetical protein